MVNMSSSYNIFSKKSIAWVIMESYGNPLAQGHLMPTELELFEEEEKNAAPH